MEDNEYKSESDFLADIEEASKEQPQEDMEPVEALEESSEESKDEAVKVEKIESSEEIRTEPPEIKSEEGLEKPETEDTKKPTFRILDGETEFEIPTTALIDVTTKSGKRASASLEELKNDFWGKQEISRRMTEFDKERKETENLKKFKEDILDAHSGLEGAYKIVEVFKTLAKHDKKIAEDLEDFVDLVRVTEQKELEKEWLERENKGLRKKAESEKMSAERKQLAEYEKGRISSLKESFDLSDENLTRLVEDVRSELEREGRLETVSLDKAWDLVEERATQLTDLTRMIDVLSEVDPELAEKDEAVYDLYAIYIRDRSIDKEALKAKAKSLFGYQKAIKEANDKIKQKEKVTGRKTRPATAKHENFVTEERMVKDPDKEFLKDVLGG